MARGIARKICSAALLLTCPLLLPAAAADAADAVLPSGGTRTDMTADCSDNWLGRINFYRTATGLSPVTENLVLSAGDRCHAAYIVKNEILKHSENSLNRFFTPQGRAAAEQSNLFVSADVDDTDRWIIDTWMQSPFHAVGVIDPRLREVGYGSYREVGGRLETGAALNVIAGIDHGVGTYPVFWPGSGTMVPIDMHWGGYPSPLASCPGYSAPSGLPLILQLGPGDLDPVIAASSLKADGRPLEHCVFSESTYRNPDRAQQKLGRSILAARDAIVIVPRFPLVAGATHIASVTVGELTYAWSFRVEGAAQVRQGLFSSIVAGTGK